MVNFFSNIQIYSATNDQNVKSIDEQGNFILTVIFRFSYGFIALVLLIYCNVYMLLIWVYHLFSFLIKEMSSQIDNKECLSFLSIKIESLIKLNELYSENPNTIIKQIENDKQHQIQKIRSFIKTRKSTKNVIEIENSNDNKNLSPLNTKELNDLTIIPIHFSVLSLVAVVYCIIIVVLTCNMIRGYHTYHTILGNTIDSYLIEDTIFDNINYFVLKTAIGVESDGAIFNKSSSYDHINSLTESVYELMNTQSKTEAKSIFSSVLLRKQTLTCAIIVNQYNAYLLALNNETNYLEMLTSICNMFNPNKYADLDKDYKEALYYTQLKNNELTSISYENLFARHCDVSIYSLITLLLLFFRPVSSLVRDSLNIPLLLSSGNDYINMSWYYVIFAGVSMVLLFFVFKAVITNRLNRKYFSLNLLNRVLFIYKQE